MPRLHLRHQCKHVCAISYLVDEQVCDRRETTGHPLELKRGVLPTDADLEVTYFSLAVTVFEAEHDADGNVLDVNVETSASGLEGKVAGCRE